MRVGENRPLPKPRIVTELGQPALERTVLVWRTLCRVFDVVRTQSRIENWLESTYRTVSGTRSDGLRKSVVNPASIQYVPGSSGV